jgi:hypothetical protein
MDGDDHRREGLRGRHPGAGGGGGRAAEGGARVVPGLAVVLVGEDPASQVYVRSKGKQTVEAGMASFEHRLEAGVSEAELLGSWRG